MALTELGFPDLKKSFEAAIDHNNIVDERMPPDPSLGDDSMKYHGVVDEESVKVGEEAVPLMTEREFRLLKQTGHLALVS